MRQLRLMLNWNNVAVIQHLTEEIKKQQNKHDYIIMIVAQWHLKSTRQREGLSLF